MNAWAAALRSRRPRVFSVIVGLSAVDALARPPTARTRATMHKAVEMRVDKEMRRREAA